MSLELLTFNPKSNTLPTEPLRFLKDTLVAYTCMPERKQTKCLSKGVYFQNVLANVTGVHNYEIQVCIYNPYFEQMVGQIYPNELQFNKANSPDAEAPCLDLNLSITNGIVSSKMYDKRDDINFEIVKIPFLMEMFLARSPSIGVYISQLIRFARMCSNVDDFNNRNLFLTATM